MRRIWLLIFCSALALLVWSPNALAAGGANGSSPLCDARESGFDFMLRSDFTDLGPLSCTHSASTAQGATISWANNLFTGQNSAAADGLATLNYTCYGSCGPNIVGYSIGPYLQGDNTYQFQPSKTQDTNGDTLTPGVFGEIAVLNPFQLGYDDFRVRDGEAFADTQITGQTRANSFVAEWIPTYRLGSGLNLGLPNEVGHTGLYYIMTTEIIVQYDRLDGGKSGALIFSTSDESLRIGPQVAVQVILDPAKIPSGLGPLLTAFLTGASTTVTNHESWDEYSGREYSWTQVAVTYTFPAPNDQPFRLGVTSSYGYGNLEASGTRANQVKLGFAIKF